MGNSTRKRTVHLPPLDEMIAFDVDSDHTNGELRSHGPVRPKPVDRSADPESLPHSLTTCAEAESLPHPVTTRSVASEEPPLVDVTSSMGATFDFGWGIDMGLENYNPQDCLQDPHPDLLDVFMQATGGEYNDSPPFIFPMVHVTNSVVESTRSTASPNLVTPGIPPDPTSLPEPITESITQQTTLNPITQLKTPEPMVQSTTPIAIVEQQQGLITSEVGNSLKSAAKQMMKTGSKVKKGAKNSPLIENKNALRNQARPKPWPVGRKSGNDAGQPQAPRVTGVPLPDLTNSVSRPVRERKRKEPGDRAYEIQAEELERKKRRARRDDK